MVAKHTLLNFRKYINGSFFELKSSLAHPPIEDVDQFCVDKVAINEIVRGYSVLNFNGKIVYFFNRLLIELILQNSCLFNQANVELLELVPGLKICVKNIDEFNGRADLCSVEMDSNKGQKIGGEFRIEKFVMVNVKVLILLVF